MINSGTQAGLEVNSTGKAEGLSFRFYREGDIPAIVDLINAAHEAHYVNSSTSEEELAASYAQPLSQPERQVILAESREGKIVGLSRAICFDDAAGDERLYQMRVLAHPTVYGEGIEKALAVRMLDNIRVNEREPEMQPRGIVSILAMIGEEDEPGHALMREMSLRAIRHGWTMQRSLDLPIAVPAEIAGVTMRNPRTPEDNAALLHAYNNSFIDHFEFHALTQEMWDYQMQRPGTRPDLSWVAEIEDEASTATIVGFCICDVNEQENARSGKQEGWIALLGTVRGWRGKGLGRSLLLRGLRSLQEAGMHTALLGVDSESLTGANRLYESVGFTIRKHDTLYKCRLGEARL